MGSGMEGGVPDDLARNGKFPASQKAVTFTMEQRKSKKMSHIVLTTHPRQIGVDPHSVKWGEADPHERGPIIATTSDMGVRNSVGCHSGSYSIYRAISVVVGNLDPNVLPDYTNTHPAVDLPFNENWATQNIVSLDPFGHLPQVIFKDLIDQGVDIRPTIAVTKAHINIPELMEMVKTGEIKADGEIVKKNGGFVATKAAVDPVWYLPGVARKFGVTEAELRKALFQETGGMYPELITRSDLNVFLPPVGGSTVYIFGPPEYLRDPTKKIAVRVHDECNGSDVFGSDICTCRPYLTHGIQGCVEMAQRGGAGVIVYFRKEGRCLGEVTKFLVYNARKRQEGGDRAATYFKRTECVAGVQDARFQALMPDVLLWLGIKRIDELYSMSDMKHGAITDAGIEVVKRIPIPDHMIPDDGRVEIDAKIYAGYFHHERKVEAHELDVKTGRDLEDYEKHY